MLRRALFLVIIAFVFLTTLCIRSTDGFLTFSDSAKYADIAKNIVTGNGYTRDFTFFTSIKYPLNITKIWKADWPPPVSPVSIAVFFSLFGVTDKAVAYSSVFFFSVFLLFSYFLAKKLYGRFAGILVVFVFLFSNQLLQYATNGATEMIFLAEEVAALYFVSLRTKISNLLTILTFILMYLTRAHYFIIVAGVIFYFLLNRFNFKKSLIILILLFAAWLIIDFFVFGSIKNSYWIYSIVKLGNYTSSTNSGTSPSDVLRGMSTGNSLSVLIKSVFYNLYNFYKLLPQIFNPYLFALFAIGLFSRGRNKMLDSFKVATLFIVAITFLVTAASIPFFRYIHPIMPLIYIIAIGTLLEIFSNFYPLNSIQIFSHKLSWRNKNFKDIASICIILFFVVGQTVGILLLDSRFERNTHNVGKPPIYVNLSWTLKDNTNKNQVIITNLDTWGSWYGERKTIWFPLEPKQLIDTSTGKIPFDAIYLTNYLIDDQNYYMGDSWRQILDNPADSTYWKCDGCKEIANEFRLKGVYTIPANENYEREVAHAVLLVRK